MGPVLSRRRKWHMLHPRWGTDSFATCHVDCNKYHLILCEVRPSQHESGHQPVQSIPSVVTTPMLVVQWCPGWLTKPNCGGERSTDGRTWPSAASHAADLRQYPLFDNLHPRTDPDKMRTHAPRCPRAANEVSNAGGPLGNGGAAAARWSRGGNRGLTLSRA